MAHIWHHSPYHSNHPTPLMLTMFLVHHQTKVMAHIWHHSPYHSNHPIFSHVFHASGPPPGISDDPYLAPFSLSLKPPHSLPCLPCFWCTTRHKWWSISGTILPTAQTTHLSHAYHASGEPPGISDDLYLAPFSLPLKPPISPMFTMLLVRHQT